MPANGHGRSAKRHTREDFWDRRLCQELCPWFRSRVQASLKSVCFCRVIPYQTFPSPTVSVYSIFVTTKGSFELKKRIKNPSKEEKLCETSGDRSAVSAVLSLLDLKAVLNHLFYTEYTTEITSQMLRRRCNLSILTERLGNFWICQRQIRIYWARRTRSTTESK